MASHANNAESQDIQSVLVIGGAGYVGSVLVGKLLNQGYRVRVFDILYFGKSHLPKHENLEVIQGDLCDIPSLTEALQGQDAIIHLACISNDPSFELDPGLSKRVNFDAFEPGVLAAKKAGVRRFIYASTASVYGVSDAKEITEDHPQVPLTDYNKYKGLSEPYLLKHQDENFVPVVIRPATVCGYSPRMRLDLSVNILTNHAYHNGKIKIFGGKQLRPNIHIEDITDLYIQLLEMPAELIGGETFNCGYQNLSIEKIAQIVKETVEDRHPEKGNIELEYVPSNDQRSYHISSRKIFEKLGFKPKHSIRDAVEDLCKAFEGDKLPDSFEQSEYFNIKQMKQILGNPQWQPNL